MRIEVAAPADGASAANAVPTRAAATKRGIRIDLSGARLPVAAALQVFRCAWTCELEDREPVAAWPFDLADRAVRDTELSAHLGSGRFGFGRRRVERFHPEHQHGSLSLQVSGEQNGR